MIFDRTKLGAVPLTLPVTGLPAMLSSGIERFSRDRRAQQLFLIHIGKCGGSSLRRAVAESRVVKNKFTGVRRFHFEEPFFSDSAEYLVAVRNPISRIVSAYNYRRQSLIRGGEEKRKGERQTFEKFQSLSQLAENLYMGGEPNEEVFRHLRSIHHIGDESFSYYLSPLLERLESRHLFGIIAIESFVEDSRRILAVSPPHRRKTAVDSVGGPSSLSSLAKSNLRLALAEDFRILDQLLGLERPSRARVGLLET